MDWYPHHIDDYDADTLHLTLAEDGAYSRLIRWYYKHERTLPNDDQALAAICRIGLEEWRGMADKIKALFVTRDTRSANASVPSVLAHKRCDKVIVAQTKKRKDWRTRQEKQRKNGILDDVTRDSGVTHASRGEERRYISSLRSDIPAVPALTLELEPHVLQADKPKAIKGTRMTEDMALPELWATWARQEGHPDPEAEWERFRDYWVGVAGKDGVKTDWKGTWRNRVRSALQRGTAAVGRKPVNGNSNGHAKHLTEAERLRFLDGYVAHYQRCGEWHGEGPRPGYPGCTVPIDILARHGYTAAAQDQ